LIKRPRCLLPNPFIWIVFELSYLVNWHRRSSVPNQCARIRPHGRIGIGERCGQAVVFSTDCVGIYLTGTE
jgi:hypothetical protein